MKFEEMINKVINCDCYEMIKNIPDKSIDLVYIDIPYLYSGYHKNKTNYKKMVKDETVEEIKKITNGIDYSIFDELCRVLKKTNIFIWCSKEQILYLLDYFVNVKKCHFDIITWHKTNPTPLANNTFLPDTEYCLNFREKGVELSGQYNLKFKYYISPINTNDKDKFNHPTIKPLQFVKNHINLSTKPNDIVLDCFCGSGTTCVACKETGRRFIGMEINKEYYEIAQKRINGITANGQMSMMFNDKGEPLND